MKPIATDLGLYLEVDIAEDLSWTLGDHNTVHNSLNHTQPYKLEIGQFYLVLTCGRTK